MEKRYQVFVSSTYSDLQEERRKVIQTLMEMDCIPSGMEVFPAIDEEQWEFIKRIIADCDYYILIVGGRYGSTTPEGISYTEKEYEYAVSIGLKIIALLHKNPENIPVKNAELDPNLRARLDAFRLRVENGRLVKYWTNADELPGLVALSLSKTIKTYPAKGWVRADQFAIAEMINEINELRKRNQELESLTNQNSPKQNRSNNKSSNTEKHKLLQEERTALFINLAGVYAQQELSSTDEGISSNKLLKILANAILDWHWLSKQHPTKFQFHGIGELKWVPVRGGATSLVTPGIDYAGIKLHHGYFANPVDLFNLSLEYRKYGFKGIIGKNNFLFPPFIQFETLEKSLLEKHEIHYWEILIKAYAGLNDSALNALASCRNNLTSVLCIWTQFALWKRYMEIAVDILRQETIDLLDVSKKEKISGRFQDAGKCIEHVFSLINYKDEVLKFRKQIEKRSENTELHFLIPQLEEQDSSLWSDKYEEIKKLSYLLKDLNSICEDFQVHIGLIEQKK